MLKWGRSYTHNLSIKWIKYDLGIPNPSSHESEAHQGVAERAEEEGHVAERFAARRSFGIHNSD